MSLLRSPKRTPVPTAEGEEAGAERSRGYGATAGSGEPTQRSQSFSESFSEAASTSGLPRLVATILPSPSGRRRPSRRSCPLGGAAVYQFFPFLSQNARVMDSIFFNNYGLRTLSII